MQTLDTEISWETKLAKVLDQHQRGWQLDWADPSDLLEIAKGNINSAQLKYRTGQRLFHRILHAALEAGIVRLP
jgi:hypothetical protein